MSNGRARLDRAISKALGIPRREVQLLLARGCVCVGSRKTNDGATLVDDFSRVEVNGRLLAAKEPTYLMLHKPVGILSATRDSVHPTVIDLLQDPHATGCIPKDQLHIAGRLDRSSSGLILLTNDSQWSGLLSRPESEVAKRYRVRVRDPLTPACVDAFAQGMHFAYENIVTRPAQLTVLTANEAEVVLLEGRYHQIKRMFGRFRNPVLELHRTDIGPLSLDPGLAPGQYRTLRPEEVERVWQLRHRATLTRNRADVD